MRPVFSVARSPGEKHAIWQSYPFFNFWRSLTVRWSYLTYGRSECHGSEFARRGEKRRDRDQQDPVHGSVSDQHIHDLVWRELRPEGCQFYDGSKSDCISGTKISIAPIKGKLPQVFYSICCKTVHQYRSSLAFYSHIFLLIFHSIIFLILISSLKYLYDTGDTPVPNKSAKVVLLNW